LYGNVSLYCVLTVGTLLTSGEMDCKTCSPDITVFESRIQDKFSGQQKKQNKKKNIKNK